MGHTNKAMCNKCGAEFKVVHGGGFLSHILRCDLCGEGKTISFGGLGEFHPSHLKELSGKALQKYERDVHKHAPVKPMSEKKCRKAAEKAAGKCACGGKFALTAPPRCPTCHSTDIAEGEVTTCAD